jgi:hypothetical protein
VWRKSFFGNPRYAKSRHDLDHQIVESSGPLICSKEVMSSDFGKREELHRELMSREIPTCSEVEPQDLTEVIWLRHKGGAKDR